MGVGISLYDNLETRLSQPLPETGKFDEYVTNIDVPGIPKNMTPSTWHGKIVLLGGPEPQKTTKSSTSDVNIETGRSTSGFAAEISGEVSISRCQSPWLERWYQEGPILSFQEFGARIALAGLYRDPARDSQRHTSQ